MNDEITRCVNRLLSHTSFANKMTTDDMRRLIDEEVRICVAEVLRTQAHHMMGVAEDIHCRRPA